jgi:hypothetical protein
MREGSAMQTSLNGKLCGQRMCAAGGLLLPVLGALPDSLIIVVSGIGVSREVAEEQVRGQSLLSTSL